MVMIAALGLLPLQAGVVTESYTQAQAVNHGDGFVLVAYPDGWDARGQQTAKRWLSSEALLEAAGETAIIPVPVPQITTDETRARYKEILGKLELPKAGVYPALLFLTEDGHHYATIAEPGMRRMKSGALAPLVEQKLDAGRRQRTLLNQTKVLKPGPEKARLLGEAASISGVNHPKGLVEELRRCDPEDTLGYIRRFTFNPWAFASSTVKDWTFEESESKILAMLEDSAYTVEQKQKLHATYIGLLRRKGGPGSMQRMAELIEKMRAMNPDDLLAKSAPIAYRQWIKSFSLADGWSPAVLPGDDKAPLELHGPVCMPDAGTYELIFQYASGKDGLEIAAVELYDGETKITEDRHDASAVSRSRDRAVVYSLTVPAPVAEPRIFVTLRMNGKRDSAGSISLKKK